MKHPDACNFFCGRTETPCDRCGRSWVEHYGEPREKVPRAGATEAPGARQAPRTGKRASKR